jgi:hypothetical protein
MTTTDRRQEFANDPALLAIYDLAYEKEKYQWDIRRLSDELAAAKNEIVRLKSRMLQAELDHADETAELIEALKKHLGVNDSLDNDNAEHFLTAKEML